MVEKFLGSIEARLNIGQELSRRQLRRLRSADKALLTDISPEAQMLSQRIAVIRDHNLRLRHAKYINNLEGLYDSIHEEYLSPATSPERKAELAEESRRISQELRMLQQ